MNQNKSLSKFDKNCLLKAIDVSKETHKDGNFPIGAVLAFDNEIIDIAGNERNKQKSWVTHAENLLIIKNDKLIVEASKQNKVIKIYSTLEPCIQCLGAAVVNRVDQIFFIEKDPIGGACNLKPNTIGFWYKERWPEINYCPILKSQEGYFIKHLHDEVEKGILKVSPKMMRFIKSKVLNKN